MSKYTLLLHCLALLMIYTAKNLFFYLSVFRGYFFRYLQSVRFPHIHLFPINTYKYFLYSFLSFILPILLPPSFLPFHFLPSFFLPSFRPSLLSSIPSIFPIFLSFFPTSILPSYPPFLRPSSLPSFIPYIRPPFLSSYLSSLHP